MTCSAMTKPKKILKWVEGQAFADFNDWECFQANYWSGGNCRHDQFERSSDVLNSSLFMDAMRSVVLCWPITSAVHLSNANTNRRSWLGQVACFFETGNCAECTVRAWFQMKQSEQKAANYVANELVRKWNEVNFDKESYQQPNGQLELAFWKPRKIG